MSAKNICYLCEFSAAMILYGALLVAVNLIGRFWSPHGTARLALALLPLLGCVALLWAIRRGFRNLDEMQRRVQFEALAFAFAATALLTFGYGFLEGAGLPHFPIFGVWPLMAVCWMAGLLLTSRRYQ